MAFKRSAVRSRVAPPRLIMYDIIKFKFKTMKKILILSLFISANAYAGYDAWIKYYDTGDWQKYGSYQDYAACERAIKYLVYKHKKCMPN